MKIKPTVFGAPAVDGCVAVYAQDSPLRDLCKIVSKNSDGETVCSYSSDISVLLNQKRLDALGTSEIKDFIANLGSDAPSSQDGLTDAQRLDFVKPRNIQSLSELRDYTEYLEANYDNIYSDYQHQQESLKQNKGKSDDDKPSDGDK